MKKLVMHILVNLYKEKKELILNKQQKNTHEGKGVRKNIGSIKKTPGVSKV